MSIREYPGSFNVSGYIRIMRTHNTFFLLAYSPRMPSEIVHLRSQICCSGIGGPKSAWIDIRANCPRLEFLQQVVNRIGCPFSGWQLSALEDASDPDF
ncbi:MAG: hypothetical protein AAF921_18685 [Cyanobacteria bacterium P01_D01_bin.44]